MVKVFRGSPLLGCPILNVYERPYPQSHALVQTVVQAPYEATRYTLTPQRLIFYDADNHALVSVFPMKEFVL